ncbi:E3 UFM1-protein ligase 1 [Lepeophtheirus salmonis]|uniref:E3 UFM1-protein ligase 1 n=1 Tax=Lepeophtheirus salmonis TaxID=72036 RepID=UPI001AE7CC78|nr:E3 UFM1-protein ligase 1-like [Lepeophtheirus salmonis]
MSDDWEEIRRLAGDLQRIQLSGASQKLSERNIIEIVMKLQSCGLLDVLHTSDGKKYITPQHLLKEIKEELDVCGGRIPLGELAKILCVDYVHVEIQSSILSKSDSSVFLVLGQLVNNDYIDRLCEEVNEVLQQKGCISIATLTKEYDLPSEFLEEQIGKRIGSIIEGFKDEENQKNILTMSYVLRQKARVRGVLSAITVPTGVASLIQKFDFSEELFFSMADELIRLGRIHGSLIGGKKASKATYIPHAYQKSQNEWVDSFFATNSYLEYDALSRLGIQDTKSYIKKRFKDSDIVYLSSCAVGQVLVDSIDASIDEVITSNFWMEARTLLPSILSDEDIRTILKKSIDERDYSASIVGDTVVISNNFISKLKEPFTELIRKKAQEDVDSGKIASIISGKNKSKLTINEDTGSKKDDRRKKATGGKVGGGTQGRETKTKSTKKKKQHKKEKFSDSEDENELENDATNLIFMTAPEIKHKIKIMDCVDGMPDDVYEELASLLQPEFNTNYADLAKEWYQSAISASMQNKRKALGDISEKVSSIVCTIRLFNKGISVFKDDSVKSQLEKHLVKTICTDLINEIFISVNNSPEKITISSSEQRSKLLQSMSTEQAKPLLKIHKALGGGNVDEFIETLEDNFEEGVGVSFRSKPDKKKDRQVLFSHRQNLLEQLNACPEEEEALILHLVVLISFQLIHNQMIHASGKFVPQIISLLNEGLDSDAQILLASYQSKVIELLKANDESEKNDIKGFLVELTPAVKKLPSMLKKTADPNA